MMRLLLATLIGLCHGLPVQFTINQRASECVYEELNAGEAATMAVFVLSGKSLRASLEIHGPMGNPGDILTGMDLQEHANKFDKGERFGQSIQFSAVVNFEHLNLGELPDDGIVTEAIPGETAEDRKKRRAEERKQVLEARKRKEEHAKVQKTLVRNEGEPYLKTVKPQAAGWYRFCVKATWNQITAEVELRKESELGGTDEYGHVWTFGQKVMAAEEKLMDEDTAAMEGIKDEDFAETRSKLKQLRRLLSEIQSKQNQERHRLAVHSATNEHSHSRMALNSLMETVLFMAVTGYQVYTIRRWFKSASILGR